MILPIYIQRFSSRTTLSSLLSLEPLLIRMWTWSSDVYLLSQACWWTAVTWPEELALLFWAMSLPFSVLHMHVWALLIVNKKLPGLCLSILSSGRAYFSPECVAGFASEYCVCRTSLEVSQTILTLFQYFCLCSCLSLVFFYYSFMMIPTLFCQSPPPNLFPGVLIFFPVW